MDTATLTREVGEERADVVAPHLCLVLERGRPLAGGAGHSLGEVERITFGRGPARAAHRIVEGGTPTLVLVVPDRNLSVMHAVVDRRAGGWVFSDRDSTNGSLVDGVRAETTVLRDGSLLELGGSLFRFRAEARFSPRALGDVDSSTSSGLVAAVGSVAPELTARLDAVERVARSGVAVLLLGESGTGKEVLARAIHEESGRRGPFVAVNCGALPQPLVESLLFGHRKGAFSGATTDSAGFIRASSGGTLFLDEIGDLPSHSQAAFLRVLQEREVVPVGDTRPVGVDLRVIAATNRPLERLVESGQFREDLLARLAGFPFCLPPLRERRDDLGVLVAAILRKLAGNARPSPSLSRDAVQTLLSYDWPRNVRELEQCLSVAFVLSEEGKIARLDVAGTREANRSSPSQTVPQGDAHLLSAEDEVLRKAVIQRLIEHDGNITRAGEAMGKARTQMQRWIKRLQIEQTRLPTLVVLGVLVTFSFGHRTNGASPRSPLYTPRPAQLLEVLRRPRSTVHATAYAPTTMKRTSAASNDRNRSRKSGLIRLVWVGDSMKLRAQLPRCTSALLDRDRVPEQTSNASASGRTRARSGRPLTISEARALIV